MITVVITAQKGLMASVQKQAHCRFWIAVFRDKTGRQKRRSTRCTDRRQAQKIAEGYEQAFSARDTVAHIRRTLRELTLDLGGGDAVMTAGDFFKAWYERKRPSLAAESQTSYKAKLDAFQTFLAGVAPADIPADGITPEMVANFRDKLATQVAPTTVNLCLTVLRKVFSDGQAWGHLTRNVVKMVDPVKDRGATCNRRPFTLHEIKLVLSTCDSEWRSMVLFGLYTGARLGDIASLTWEAVDLDRGELRYTTRKTGRAMQPAIAPPLRSHILAMPSADNPKAPLHPRAHAIMQESGSGTLSRQFGELLQSVGLSRAGKPHRKADKTAPDDRRRENNELSFHALRHTAATWLRDAGASESVAREIVGHDSESVARQYVHAGRGALQKAVDALPDVTRMEVLP